MAYQMISYGSSGAAVKELQTLLNSQGYALDVDGVFGAKTRSAVKSYQKKSGLRLDGIVGEETWGSLHNAQQEAAQAALAAQENVPRVSAETAAKLAELEKGYRPSDRVQEAEAAVSALESAAPQEFRSGFEQELAALYNEISARPAFSYDAASDPAYAAYAAQYQRQGRAAMTDTLGKAAHLTGGYGSTYAQSAAQQAYEGYLDKLNDMVPALEKNAYARYQAQGQALLDRYSLLKSEDNEAYRRWQDEGEAWQKAVTAAQNQYKTLSSDDLENYRTLLKYYADKAQKELAGKL